MDLLKERFTNCEEESRKTMIGTFATGDSLFG